MNNQDKLYLAATRYHIRQWAYWSNDILIGKLRYSRKSTLMQLIDSKGEAIRSTRPDEVSDNTQVEQIDELINHYAIEHPVHVQVLKLHYLQKIPLKKKLEIAQMPQTTYFRYLTNTENWITKQLISKYIQ